MKNAPLQFDEVMTEYLQYAAAIKRKPVEKFIESCRRKYYRSRKVFYGRTRVPARVVNARPFYTVQRFLNDTIGDVIESHERRNGLPESYTNSRRPRRKTEERCWNNMLANRAALV